MSGLIAFIVILWLVLATAVAFHAKGHDKSALFWFAIVFVTGFFGVIFYLLAITSGSSNESTEGEPTGHLPDSGATARTFEDRVRNQEALFVAVKEHLQNHEVVTKKGLQNEIYPEYHVGYESAANWWDEFLLPELEDRDEFERVDGIENGWKLASND